MSHVHIPQQVRREREDARIAALISEVRDYIRHQTALGVRVFRVDIRNVVNTPERPVGITTLQKVIERLADEGSIQSYGHSEGWIAVGVVRASLNLKILVDRARECVDDTWKAPLGRRGSTGDVLRDRRLDRLTPSHFQKICTGVAVVAQGLTGSKKDLAGVGPEHFAWNVGAGQWALASSVADWSRTLRTGEASSVAAHVDGIELLLDLAATKGWITRAEQFDQEFLVHAAEWLPTISVWHAGIVRTGDSESTVRMLLYGLREIALAATRRGWLDDNATDFGSVMSDILGRRSSSTHKISQARLDCARLAYNRLCNAGIISGAPWGRTRHERDGLVSMAAIKRAIGGDWSLWCDADGKPYAGLLGRLVNDADEPIAKGDFGLMRYIKWLDERTTQVEFERFGLPARSYVDADERTLRMQERKKDQGKASFRQRQSSLEQTLVRLNVIAGMLASVNGVDWTDPQASLLAHVSKATVVAYADHWTKQRGLQGVAAQKSNTVSYAAFALAQYGSPFAHGIAVASGDCKLSDQLASARKQIAVFAESYKPREDQKVRTQRRVAHWENGGTSGYGKVGELVNCLISLVIKRGGGLPLEEQVIAIQNGTFSPPGLQRWATAIRDAAAFHFLWRLPTRAGSLGRLRMQSWVSTGARPWEGAIQVEYEAWEVKQSRKFMPHLFDKRYLGNPEAERLFHRVLFQLLLMENGARDTLLSLPDDTKAECPYIFCSSAQGGRNAEERASRRAAGLPFSNVSAQFGGHIDRFAPTLGLDSTLMKDGSKGVHIFRHLFASAHSDDLGIVRLILGHASVKTTEGIYAATSEKNVVVDDLRVRAGIRRGDPVASGGVPASAQGGPTLQTIPSVEISEELVCYGCYEPRRVMGGVPAPRCHQCGTVQ